MWQVQYLLDGGWRFWFEYPDAGEAQRHCDDLRKFYSVGASVLCGVPWRIALI